MKHLYGKNRPAQAGIPVAETGIPARRDGTKNVPPPYKQYAIKTIETYTCRGPWLRPVSVNVPSCLSYKQALRYLREKSVTNKLLISSIVFSFFKNLELILNFVIKSLEFSVFKERGNNIWYQ